MQVPALGKVGILLAGWGVLGPVTNIGVCKKTPKTNKRQGGEEGKAHLL